MKKKKKRKEEFIDDGRTIANMNVEGFKWYVSDRSAEEKKKLEGLKITRKERWAMLKAAFITIVPVILLYLLGFLMIISIIMLWLK